MLLSDMVLAWDPAFRAVLEEYAEDEDLLSSDFGKAFKKLTEVGQPPLTLTLILTLTSPRPHRGRTITRFTHPHPPPEPSPSARALTLTEVDGHAHAAHCGRVSLTRSGCVGMPLAACATRCSCALSGMTLTPNLLTRRVRALPRCVRSSAARRCCSRPSPPAECRRSCRWADLRSASCGRWRADRRMLVRARGSVDGASCGLFRRAVVCSCVVRW
jgi:hypothetical protein